MYIAELIAQGKQVFGRRLPSREGLDVGAELPQHLVVWLGGLDHWCGRRGRGSVSELCNSRMVDRAGAGQSPDLVAQLRCRVYVGLCWRGDIEASPPDTIRIAEVSFRIQTEYGDDACHPPGERDDGLVGKGLCRVRLGNKIREDSHDGSSVEGIATRCVDIGFRLVQGDQQLLVRATKFLPCRLRAGIASKCPGSSGKSC